MQKVPVFGGNSGRTEKTHLCLMPPRISAHRCRDGTQLYGPVVQAMQGRKKNQKSHGGDTQIIGFEISSDDDLITHTGHGSYKCQVWMNVVIKAGVAFWFLNTHIHAHKIQHTPAVTDTQ